MTDKELIEGCLRKDPHAQKALFVRYAGTMMAVCIRYARHRLEAEDILQEAFIRVYDNLDRFQFKGAFEGWIRRIVINTALKNYQRKQYSQEQIGLENLPETSSEPVAYAQLGEAELLDMITRLPEGYRLVFNLYAIEGYSHKEIADMLGIQESTSRTQLLKARKLLQSQIERQQRLAV